MTDQPIAYAAPSTEPGLLHIRALAAKLGRSRATIYNWLSRGVLPQPRRIGNRPYWRSEDITAWMAGLSQETGARP